MCCPGCVAVAQIIKEGGLSDFYLRRTQYNEKPEEASGKAASEFAVYDDEAYRETFVQVNEEGGHRASLLVGGVTCAACTWLIETVIGKVDGVERVTVSLSESRLDIEWQPANCKLSQIFDTLAKLGYTAQPYEVNERRKQLAAQRRDALKKLAVAGLGMMQVGMFAIALHAGGLQGMAMEYESLLRWVSLPVAVFVVGYSARDFFVTAWRHIRHGALVMDLPIAIAIGLALGASCWATATGAGDVYFDSVVMFTFFLLLARYLEQSARLRLSSQWSSVAASLPAAVSVLRDGKWLLTPRLRVSSGDRLLVKPGEVIANDAVVSSGTSEVREDSFTGEPLPRNIKPGDAVYAGTVNLSQAIEIEVVADCTTNRLALLEHSVQTAQMARPALATLADKVAAWFVGGVLILAFGTFFVWYNLAPERALWITLSVLVISCPCALALATPAALTTAAGALRQRGIVVNAENALEALYRSTHMVFDKTGTLTVGELSLVQISALSGQPEQYLLETAAAMQQHSSHPVARALSQIQVNAPLNKVVTRQGEGVETSVGATTLRMGSDAFCRALAPSLPKAPCARLYWVALVQDDTPLAWFGFQDELRSEAASVVAFAKQQGLKVELLTGDASPQVENVAGALDIRNVTRGASPEEKMARVQRIQAEGGIVCMVGDGLNDAPVLSVADVSISVAEATALARTQASLVLLDKGLSRVIDAQMIASRAYQVMRQNIGWALTYNIAAIPMAMMGLVPPWLAALGMSASSLIVVGNALRLSRMRLPLQPHTLSTAE